MTYRWGLFVAASLLVAACAARGPAPQTLTAIARADQLVVDGCYSCLLEALDIFEQQLKRGRIPAGAAQRAFETALLAALREKELGIPPDATLARARALARLAEAEGAALRRRAKPVAAAPAEGSPDALIELAQLAPGEASGLDPESARPTSAGRARLRALRAMLDAETRPTLLTTYLALMIDCDSFQTRQKIAADAVPARHRDAAMLRFRLAACGVGGGARAMRAIRDADPRWRETTFFEGRAALGMRPPNLRAALDLFAEAHAALPRSAAVLLALAHAQRAYSELEAAIASYDGVIAMVPTIREALLGRTIALTYLKRHDEAVASATRMIDLGTWLLPDAYYWRAWNRYALKQLEEAWTDAEHALKLSANTAVYTLAGVIAYERQLLDTAKDMFLRATQMDQTNCDAQSYLGLVHAAQDMWPAATPVFSTAMSCFIQAAAQARRELAELERPSDDPVYTGRLAADRRKAIEDADRKAAEAAYNAAQGFLRADKRPEALGHLQRALEYPALRTQAEALKKLIER